MVLKHSKGTNLKLFNEAQLGEYLHCGRTLAREIGKKANARIRVGRRVLYDADRVAEYIENCREETV